MSKTVQPVKSSAPIYSMIIRKSNEILSRHVHNRSLKNSV